MGLVFRILLGFLAYSCLWQEAEAESCPTEWKLIGKHCYGYFESFLSWLEAEKDCNTYKGGHLASIHSEDEMDKVADFIRTRFMPSDHIWIGLNTDQVGWDRDWKWSDGTPAKYMPWGFLQPNNENFNEQCVELFTYDLKTWNDYDCARRSYYLCKKPAS